MHREMRQQSLAETLVSGKLGQNKRLERIQQVVDWERLDKLVEGIYSAKEGRPSYPPLMMVKVAAAGAVVQPLRPADGRSAERPDGLSSLCGLGIPGGRAGLLHHQPVPRGIGTGAEFQAVP